MQTERAIERKIEQPPAREVKAAFNNLEVDLEKDHPFLYQRLLELHSEKSSHFQDAMDMANIIDRLWSHISEDRTPEATKNMMLCALLHDIGKSGPTYASQSQRDAIRKLFDPSLKCQDAAKSAPQLTINEYIKQVIASPQDQEQIREELGEIINESANARIDLDKEKMIDFWRRHVDWTWEILTNNEQGAITRDVSVIASSHHVLDGKNPAQISEQEIPLESKTIELIDKYQFLTLLDKYQAFRDRSALSHSAAIEALRKIVSKSILNPKTQKKYLEIINIFAGAEAMLAEYFKPK